MNNTEYIDHSWGVYIAPFACNNLFKIGVSSAPAARLMALRKWHDIDMATSTFYPMPERVARRTERLILSSFSDHLVRVMGDGGTEVMSWSAYWGCTRIVSAVCVAFAGRQFPIASFLDDEDGDGGQMITGEDVRAARLRANMTQAELADAAGVSKRTIERIEDGSSVNMRSFSAAVSFLGIDPASRGASTPDRKRARGGRSAT